MFSITFGLSARGGFVLMHVLLARYFGRRSFGAITSVLEPFHKGGLGVGALLAGMAFDWSGSYQLVFLLFFTTIFSPPRSPRLRASRGLRHRRARFRFVAAATVGRYSAARRSMSSGAAERALPVEFPGHRGGTRSK